MHLSIEEIIRGCKKNDSIAQEALFKLYSKKLMTVCLRYSSCREDAEDLFQESMIKIFQSLHSFEEKGSIEGWMRRIITNNAIKEFRKRKYLSSLSEPESFNLPVFTDDDVIEKMSGEELMTVIHQLPEGSRMVFNLFVIEGYSHKEISELMQISEGTSKSQFFNAKKILKTLLGKGEKVDQLQQI
ncbi:RNA polymerase sigma factor [Sporocytophaga myxococcoides]|uniref:RNA polymerase sigma factor n=1 Tax=Sporocytophaga myxococcoides TaxID=153721 RepID=UPI0006858D1C|nr:sigma-70 family RNA polymerase sigma factor [Sporocytophaga myxococcoides]